MARSRREILMASAALVAPYVVTGSAHAAEIFDPAEPAVYFDGKGYELLPSHDLITDYTFNDGVRYDETPNNDDGVRTIRMQGCARVEDIPRRGEPGVLPYFHILAYRNAEPDFPGQMFTQIMDFLINGSGLNPHRLVLVSTDRFEPLRPYLKDFDVGPHQVVLRSWEEAKQSGDGSGYFAPPEHPHAPGMATVSIHYPMTGTPLSSEPHYPLAGYLELGEVTIPTEGDGPGVEEGGLGVERVAMARGDIVDTYEEALVVLVMAMEAEAKAREIQLPEAYHKFEAL